MAKAPWVKWYPSDFIIGTARLTPDTGWLYTVVINWIYERGAPIDDDIEELATAANMKPSKAEAALEALVRKGKLTRANGKISNARAEQEIASRASSIAKSSESATRRWESARQKNEENQPQKITPHAEVTQNPDENREEESRKRKNQGILLPEDRSARKQAKINERVDYPEEFEVLWRQYPRTAGTSKKKAYDHWRMLNDEKRERVRLAVPIFADMMRREGRAEDKIKHFQFWLSDRVYETLAVGPVSSNIVTVEWHKSATPEQWAKVMKIFAATNDWRESWGPAPGKTGCCVPIELLPEGLRPPTVNTQLTTAPG
jgi:uncharacterized protein YdaU (DUF1376 family)